MKNRYILSSPITMMEDELISLDQDYVISEKLDGTRAMVVRSQGRITSYIGEEIFVGQCSDGTDLVMDCEVILGEIVVLDVLYAGRDVTSLPLLERIKFAQKDFKVQTYINIADHMKLSASKEGWIIQRNNQDYTPDMFVYRIKRIPTIDILMVEDECDLYGVPYEPKFNKEIVEITLDGSIIRVRSDKVEPNFLSSNAREFAEDRVTWDVFHLFVTNKLGDSTVSKAVVEVKEERVVKRTSYDMTVSLRSQKKDFGNSNKRVQELKSNIRQRPQGRQKKMRAKPKVSLKEYVQSDKKKKEDKNQVDVVPSFVSGPLVEASSDVAYRRKQKDDI